MLLGTHGPEKVTHYGHTTPGVIAGALLAIYHQTFTRKECFNAHKVSIAEIHNHSKAHMPSKYAA